jgi:tRNA (Thr-GGU) A37 N-methylase
VEVVAVEEEGVVVRGLDCVDGTPLLDLKPARAP